MTPRLKGGELRKGREGHEVRSRLLAGQFRAGAAQAVELRVKWVGEEFHLNPRRSGDS